MKSWRIVSDALTQNLAIEDSLNITPQASLSSVPSMINHPFLSPGPFTVLPLATLRDIPRLQAGNIEQLEYDQQQSGN
jgi:hypothetical protein